MPKLKIDDREICDLDPRDAAEIIDMHHRKAVVFRMGTALCISMSEGMVPKIPIDEPITRALPESTVFALRKSALSEAGED